jgi:TNFR/NGFR cysteine-rich region
MAQMCCTKCWDRWQTSTDVGNMCFQACWSCQTGYGRDCSTTNFDVVSSQYSVSCAQCPAGKYSVVSNRDYYCESCPAGKYTPVAGKDYCYYCAMGTYTDSPGLTVCSLCSAGKKAEAVGMSACTSCNAGTISSAGQCICASCIPGTSFSATSGQSACIACTKCGAGTYISSDCTASSDRTCASCSSTGSTCTGYQYWSCPGGTPTGYTCTPCTGTVAGQYCAAGNEPSLVCNGKGSTDSTCAACQVGKYKDSPSVMSCVSCLLGTYTASTGSIACLPCTNKPATGAAYVSWTTPASSNSCPYQCIPGYYRSGSNCIACNKTAGKYSGASDLTACQSCTRGSTNGNSYFLIPTNFSGINNDCPWECNAGYKKSMIGTCVACTSGTTYHAASDNAVYQNQSNTCLNCTKLCANGTFMTTPCITTRNRVCPVCSAKCPTGYYVATECSQTSDLTCKACVTKCSVNQYLSATKCTGNERSDVVNSSCIACRLPGECPQNFYLNKICPGNESLPNVCEKCDYSTDCPVGTYSAGCSGLTKRYCANQTKCSTGQYLSGYTRLNDGICKTCTNCTSLNQTTVKECTMYADALCGNSLCNASNLCNSSIDKPSYCDYHGQTPVCGYCPEGYQSDGQFCMECPRGFTCGRRGDVMCKAQCSAGILSNCDQGLGYATCSNPCPGLPFQVPNATIVRGTNIRSGECQPYPYFECNAGFYKFFTTNGVVSCQPCGSLDFNRPLYSVWATPGLSPNDDRSCVWECDRKSSVMHPNGTSCILLPFRLGWTARNLPGYYTLPYATTCNAGFTSERNLAAYQADCLRCPDPPENGIMVQGSITCDWTCQYGIRRGSVCVTVETCTTAVRGFTADYNRKCQPTALPWQRAGFYKTGVTISAGSGNFSQARKEFQALSLNYSIYNRHFVLGMNQNWSVPGPVCSVCSSTIGTSLFLFLTICNQSFVGYMNLSGGAVLHVLIGNNTAGWQDGFRTEALFQNELYVTNGPSNNTLFVLDRWNCLLREIVITVPGDYLTRVYTLYGNTERFAILRQPRCYGGGSLAGPRRFYYNSGNLSDGRILFGDDNGIWELLVETRTVTLAVKGKLLLPWDPEAVRGLEVSSLFRLSLWYRDSMLVITAQASPCATGTTSYEGGACLIQCLLVDDQNRPVNFVDAVTGACVACQSPSCGPGMSLVPCSSTAQAYCQPCPPDLTGQLVYVIANDCNPALKRPVPPCRAGWYLADNSGHCDKCPSYSTTLFDNATRVQQCRCWPGFRRSPPPNRQCVATNLYSYSQTTTCPLLGQKSCPLPPNASFTATTGCDWACNTGFYRSTVVGFLDQCRPCLGLLPGSVFRTNGDDDEPLSCEFISST